MTWVEVLEQMALKDESGENQIVDLVVVAVDRKKKQAGAIRHLKNVRLCPMQGSRRSNTAKNPDHWKNATRNVLLPNGKIQKINVRFILSYNGQKVSYL